MFSLKGRVAIVTGGRGLYGAPISEGLAEAGAHVIVASRDREACDAFAAGLQGKGLSAEGAQLDLADERSVKALAAEVTNRHGRIDVLVNNAVSRGDYGDFETLTREVLKPMKAAGAGSIINISSIQGVTAPHFPYYEEGQSSPSGYTFEKWGLVGFTKWLAAMYGKDGIRANAVSPGGYHPQLQETRPRFYETYAQHTPLHKWPDRDDIKGPVCFLASDAARYVTGHNLVMDGGFTIW